MYSSKRVLIDKVFVLQALEISVFMLRKVLLNISVKNQRRNMCTH